MWGWPCVNACITPPSYARTLCVATLCRFMQELEALAEVEEEEEEENGGWIAKEAVGTSPFAVTMTTTFGTAMRSSPCTLLPQPNTGIC